MAQRLAQEERRILSEVRLTLTLLTWNIGRALNNARKWQMGLNSAFEGLKYLEIKLSKAVKLAICNPDVPIFKFLTLQGLSWMRSIVVFLSQHWHNCLCSKNFVCVVHFKLCCITSLKMNILCLYAGFDFLYSRFRASWLYVNNIQQSATVCRYLFTAKSLYKFRVSIAPIIRGT